MKTLLTALTVVMMMLFIGCKEEPKESKSPTENVEDRSSTARDEDKEVATAAGGGAAADVKVDDSSAEDVINSYVALMNAGKMESILDLIDPEQRAAWATVSEAMKPAWEAIAALQKKTDEKFPGHGLDIAAFGEGSGASLAKPQFEVVSVESTSDTEAKAVIKPKGGEGEMAYNLRKVDGDWRITDPNMGDPEEAEKNAEGMKKISGAMASASKDVTGRLDGGEFKSAQEVKKAFSDTLLKEQMKAMGLPEVPEMPEMPAIPTPPQQ